MNRAGPIGPRRLSTVRSGLARDHGNEAAEAHLFLEHCRVLRALGKLGDALVPCQRAATIQQRLRDRGREAQTLDEAGQTYLEIVQPEEAVNFHRRAVSLNRQAGDRWRLAVSLFHLTNALISTGAASQGQDS
ncbi:tetratricopeptide repeat protein [Saccharopolyspora sp. NPDC050642]|uniref:tetratricopeptide repeat protein n=1 Tax=Saccharopolyspora sp. NPDC050642 TaxID=3157099 RepID=UPI0033D6EB25